MTNPMHVPLSWFEQVLIVATWPLRMVVGWVMRNEVVSVIAVSVLLSVGLVWLLGGLN